MHEGWAEYNSDNGNNNNNNNNNGGELSETDEIINALNERMNHLYDTYQTYVIPASQKHRQNIYDYLNQVLSDEREFKSSIQTAIDNLQPEDRTQALRNAKQAYENEFEEMEELLQRGVEEFPASGQTNGGRRRRRGGKRSQRKTQRRRKSQRKTQRRRRSLHRA